MKVAFDAQIFFEQRYGGVSRYFCEIASRMAAYNGAQVSIVAPMHINAYLKYMPLPLVSGSCLPGVGKVPLSVRGVGMLIGDLMLRAISPDIIHETYYFPYRMGPGRARRVVTIHDMIHEKFSAHFSPTDRTSRFKLMAARRADYIICVSETTKRDLVEYGKIAPDRISVVYNGFGFSHDPTTSRVVFPMPEASSEPFLLYVGVRGGYKNFVNLLRAYGSSKLLTDGCRLVCFGGGGFTPEERSVMEKLGLRDSRVVHAEGDDLKLARLYDGALAFVHPSLYEGFGITPLEAMSFGCPVICSDAGSIPEIVGDAGHYFNPEDIAGMRSAIEQVAQSSALRDALVARGRQRLERFSWERCARETYAVYERLV
jgi:glycosyltransferase involved in cell wall biosynthesis